MIEGALSPDLIAHFTNSFVNPDHTISMTFLSATGFEANSLLIADNMAQLLHPGPPELSPQL